MKLFVHIILLAALLFTASTKHSRAVASQVFVGLMLAKLALESSPDLKEHCQLDPGILVASVTGAVGAGQEAIMCGVNTFAIAGTSLGAYLVGYIGTSIAASAVAQAAGVSPPAAKVIGDIAGQAAGTAAAMADAAAFIGSLYLRSKDIANDWVVCQDTLTDNGWKNLYDPLPYTDQSITNILREDNIRNGRPPNPSRKDVVDKYNKICIQRNDGSNARIWLKANECHNYSAEMICSYRYKGDGNIICVRSASTCPCRHPIDGGSDKSPQVASNIDGIMYNEDGSLKLENANNSNFLKHCRMVKSSDMFATDGFMRDGLLDPACMNLKGNSKNPGLSIAAPAAECIIGTFRNLFEKKVGNISSVVNLSDADVKLISDIQNDITILENISDILEGFMNIEAAEVPNLYLLNAVFQDIKKDVAAMKSGSLSNGNRAKLLLQYSLYSEKLKGNPSKNIAGIPSTSPYLFNDYSVLDPAKYIEFKQGMIQTYNAVKEAIIEANNQIENARYGNSGVVLDTMYGRFQSTVKSIVITGFCLYFVLLGLKILEDGGSSIDAKFIVAEAFKFGLVIYIALGDGIKDYGLNMVLRASQGVGEMMMDIISVDVRDQCSFSSTTFYVDPNKIPEKPTSPPGLTGVTGTEIRTLLQNPNVPIYLRTGTAALDDRQKKIIDGLCNITFPGMAPLAYIRTPDSDKFSFYCPRNEYIPRLNYEFPMLPVALSGKMKKRLVGDLSKYPYDHFPVRCVNSNNELLLCSDELCNGTISATAGRFPYFALRKSINGRDVLVCDKLTDTGDEAYVADGYHLDDLYNMNYVDPESRTSVSKAIPAGANFIVPTGYYSGRSNGLTARPRSLTSEDNLFYARLQRNKIIANIDVYRANLNQNYNKYAVIETPAGTTRDMKYLAMLDTLDCKMGKYIMSDSSGFPGLLTMGLKLMFTDLAGFVSACVIAVYFVMMMVVILKIAQNIIVGNVGIIFYMYLAPVTVPCCLFAFTQQVYEKWKDALIAYIMYPPASFILIVMLMKISDSVMYGTPGDYRYEYLFNDDGTISSNCLTATTQSMDDLSNAPYICLLTKMAADNAWKSYLFLSVMFLPIVPLSVIAVGMIANTVVSAATPGGIGMIVLYKSVIALFGMTIGIQLIGKFEEELQSIFGKPDLAINSGLPDIKSLSPSSIVSSTAGLASSAISVGRNITKGVTATVGGWVGGSVGRTIGRLGGTKTGD